MMNFIRTKLKFLMWFVAIAFVAGLFLVGGRAIGQNWLINIMPLWVLVQMPGCARSAGIIMKVGNYNVKIEEYERVRENGIALAQQQYGENFEAYAASMDFGVMAMENIIKYALLLQEAEKRDIYISKGELDEGKRMFPYWVPMEARSRVMPYPYYSMSRRDGKFNPDFYSYVLANYGKITPRDFAQEVENGLRIARLKDLLSQSALVTDLEIQQEYRAQNEKATIKYVEFQNKDFTDSIEIPDAELNDYFQENILKYKTKDKVSISFIKIDPKELERTIEVSPTRIVSYYRNRQKDYTEPEKVKAHHILVEVESTASAEDKAKAKAYAEKILVEAKKPGADFPAVADKFNKEPFKVKYEDITRPFDRGKMERPFEDAAFALQPGEISGVVETYYGYHVLQTQSKTPARTKTLEEVQSQIIQQLREEQAVQEARDKATDIEYDVMAEQDLQIAIDTNPDLNLKVMETGFFAKGEPIPNMGSYYTYKDIGEEAFKLRKGEFSKLVEIKTSSDVIRGYFIFKLLDKKPGGLPKLEDVKYNVLDDMRLEKAPAMAMEAAKKIMAERDPADDLDKIAEKNELKISESEPFALSERGYIKGKSFSVTSKTVMLKAFEMKTGEIAGPFEGTNGAYIIQLIGREEFNSTKFAAAKDEKKELRNQLLQQKQQKAFDTWYEKIRNDAKIKSFSVAASS